MVRRILLIAIPVLISFSSARAQDSTRAFTHEFGLNAVSLLQQLRIFTVTPGQQPYDIFYNLFYKQQFGIRLGLGVLTENTDTEIEGQNFPRSTTDSKMNLRVGGTYNVTHTKHIVFNVFVDGLINRSTVQTINTSSAQVFPNPVVTRTVKNTDQVNGGGVQAGIGLKWNMSRHLSLYTELPVMYTKDYILTEDVIEETGKENVEERTLTQRSGTRIALPVTIYLVLRF